MIARLLRAAAAVFLALALTVAVIRGAVRPGMTPMTRSTHPTIHARSRRRSGDREALLSITNPTSVFLGWDIATSVEVHLPLSVYLGRSAELIGPSGCGKTDRLMEDLRTLCLTPSSYVYYDFADTGFDQALVWDALVAELLAASVERPYAKIYPDVRGLTAAFIQRHAYATVGGMHPPIRINPLRRCTFPDGSRESVEDVVGRIHRVFTAQYPDIRDRVQFSRWLRTFIALLTAAERPISEWARIVDPDPRYRDALAAEINRLGTAADPYVRHHQAELQALLALPPKDRRDEVHSFKNSFEPFESGALAAFFTNENLPLEAVVYRGRRLFLSVSGLTSIEQRKFVMRMVWAMCDTLIAKRRFMGQAPIGVEVIDEVSWVPHDLFDVLTRRRNNRWSTITARQDAKQFEALGYEFAERLSRASSATSIRWRIETLAEAREVAARAARIDPDGWWIERFIETQTEARTRGTSLSQTEGVTRIDTTATARGTGAGVRYDVDGTLLGRDAATRDGETMTFGANAQHGSATGSTYSETYGVNRTLQPFRVGFDEQLSVRAQDYLVKPKHVAVVESEGEVQLVAMRRARQLPVMAATAAIVEDYLAINTLLHDAETVVPVNLDAPATAVALPSAPPAALPPPVAASPAPARARTVPQDSAPLTGDRTTTLLWAAAALRLLTTADALVLLGLTYDTAERELSRLTAAGLLARFKPPTPQGAGGVSFLYTVTTAGAERLATITGRDLEQLRKVASAVAKRRGDIEAGNPNHARHALAITHLACHVLRGVLDADPAAAVGTVRYDRELACYLQVGDVLARLPAIEHEHLRRSGAGQQTSWVPDLFCTVTWSPTGNVARTDAFAIEIETGAGETSPARTGAEKAAKVGVVERDLARLHRVGPIALPGVSTLTTLVWTPTSTIETGLLAGVRSVERAEKNHILTTNGELLPLAAARGTAKRDLPAALADIRRRLLGDAIWQPVTPSKPRVALVAAPPTVPARGEEV